MEAGVVRRDIKVMSRVIFLLEEKSMKELLDRMLPRIFPSLRFLCIPHEGKTDLLNGVELSEVFCLIKEDGFSKVVRPSDSDTLRDLVNGGELPGRLWRQGLFEGILK